MLVVWILLSSVIAVAVWLGFWMLVTFLVRHSARQMQFVTGKLPQSPPDGFYKGAVYMVGGGPVPTPFYKLFRKNADGNTDA